jgi:thiol-disulfide isomerase/thioredoxin/sugar lactone lactonase YvrE
LHLEKCNHKKSVFARSLELSSTLVQLRDMASEEVATQDPDYFSGAGGAVKLQSALLMRDLAKGSVEEPGRLSQYLDDAQSWSKDCLEKLIEKMSPLPSSLNGYGLNQAFNLFSNSGDSGVELWRSMLQNKIILLEFWTSGCANCMQVMPRMAESEFLWHSSTVQVVSIHGPKYRAEKDLTKLQRAVFRLNASHGQPIVQDEDKVIYDLVGVVAWPTFIVISEEGKLIFTASGEASLTPTLKLLKFMADKSSVAEEIAKEEEKSAEVSRTKSLNFPSGICCFGGSLFISDTNNHRILEVEKDSGIVKAIIGSGVAGFQDGDFETSMFNWPHGLCAFKREDSVTLAVADTNNHRIRLVDLSKRTVVTVEGKLSLPWDIVPYKDGNFFISNSGTHQIFNLLDNSVKRFAGNAVEALKDNVDGKGGLNSVSFAQPSGLDIDLQNDLLFIADCESSAIRMIDLKNQKCKTIAGGDISNRFNLMAYGDVDGSGMMSRFQHPLAVKYLPSEKCVLVCDSYNQKLKKAVFSGSISSPLDMTWNVESVSFKSAEADALDLDHPCALDSFKETENVLYICDSNNHRVVVVDWSSLKIEPLLIKFELA